MYWFGANSMAYEPIYIKFIAHTRAYACMQDVLRDSHQNIGTWGTSLVVQWLRLYASTVGALGLIPGPTYYPACLMVWLKEKEEEDYWQLGDEISGPSLSSLGLRPPVPVLFLSFLRGLCFVVFVFFKVLLSRLPGGPLVKNPPANLGKTGSIPGLERSHIPWSD